MNTTLYLVRHGATAFNLENPPRLQGRSEDVSLAPLGIRQAELTCDFLASRPIDHCYCSPLQRAVRTAEIIAAPHRLTPKVLEGLTECHVGEWVGFTWQEIADRFPHEYRRFMDNPAQFGYPGGENFADVYKRANRAIEEIFARHEGEIILVVAHHVVNRTYLAAVLGLGLNQARRVCLDNCGVSVVVRRGHKIAVETVNAHFHTLGAAA